MKKTIANSPTKDVAFVNICKSALALHSKQIKKFIETKQSNQIENQISAKSTQSYKNNSNNNNNNQNEKLENGFNYATMLTYFQTLAKIVHSLAYFDYCPSS